MLKSIVLCADDYGQDELISKGIVELIQKGRLTATSCLTTSVNWKEEALWLQPLREQADIGLHFNLTEGLALSAAYSNTYGEAFFGLPELMQRCVLRRLDPAVVAAECEAQLDRFVDCIGFLPDFMDGHQHVHQFPLIRDVFIATYEKRLRDSGAYIRLVDQKMKVTDIFNPKKIVIQGMGASGFKKRLMAKKIPHNPTFSGVYGLTQAAKYATIFPVFLTEVGQAGLVMCHPGKGGLRHFEYDYFASDLFLQHLKAAECQLSKMQAALLLS